jgi:RimJ/RimL family protein N-acetyltransferase
VAQARRIRDGVPRGGELWAADYPFEGDLAALGGFIRASVQHGEQRPFGYYQIIRRSDRQAIGGIGFKGAPQAGALEVGYGLAPSARGNGYAAEALQALMTIAAEHGVTRILADSLLDNVASQRTLEQSGFRRVAAGAELLHYEAPLGVSKTPHRHAARSHPRSA